MTQHLIGFRSFAALNTRGTEEQEHQREQALRHEFLTLVPAARRLLGSELTLQRHHTDSGCTLEYYLVSLAQYSLDFDGMESPAVVKATRDFDLDVASVREQCGNVKTRLKLAQSPALSHRELSEDSQVMRDTKTLRTIFRRRKRKVVLPTPEGDLSFDLPAVPERLPTAARCAVTANVAQLTTGRAHLCRVAVRPDPQGLASSLTLPPAMTARRPEALSPGFVARLVKCMDTKADMKLEVSVEFHWATGAPAELVLLEPIRRQKLQARRSGAGT